MSDTNLTDHGLSVAAVRRILPRPPEAQSPGIIQAHTASKEARRCSRLNSTAFLLRALSLVTHDIGAVLKEHRYKGLAHRKRQFI
jgi:hypothetical protein